jgi:hypothetical protein
LTEIADAGRSEIVQVFERDDAGNLMAALRDYAPAKNDGGFKGFLHQLTLHLSIGHAY